jgi:hypothetical protein
MALTPLFGSDQAVRPPLAASSAAMPLGCPPMLLKSPPA